MKKTLILSIILFLSLFFSVFAQSNYQKGYIITLTNDTIFGLIDFRTDRMNSEICKFIRNDDGLEYQFTPGQIAGYRFNDIQKFYVSKTVEIDSVKHTYFLEFLVQGMMNLYYLGGEQRYYFFESSDGEMISFTKKPDEITEEKRIKEDQRYKGAMRYVFRDYTPLALKTSRADFDRKTMILFTKEYHDNMCETGEKCIIFENDYKKKFTKFDFVAFSGMELNEFSFKAPLYPNMYSLSPFLGVGVNISSPRLTPSVFLNLDASFSKVAGAFDYINVFTNYSVYKFNYYKTGLFGGLEYQYHEGKIRPAANAGLSFAFHHGYNDCILTNNTTKSNIMFIDENSIGYKVGCGFDYQIKNENSIVLRLSYSNVENYYLKNVSYQLKLGYKF